MTQNIPFPNAAAIIWNETTDKLQLGYFRGGSTMMILLSSEFEAVLRNRVD
jgi:hypothetical protein